MLPNRTFLAPGAGDRRRAAGRAQHTSEARELNIPPLPGFTRRTNLFIHIVSGNSARQGEGSTPHAVYLSPSRHFLNPSPSHTHSHIHKRRMKNYFPLLPSSTHSHLPSPRHPLLPTSYPPSPPPLFLYVHDSDLGLNEGVTGWMEGGEAERRRSGGG